MAEASSASVPTTAAQLREAAKLTMRRKQAPLSKQSSTSTLRNGGAASANASPGRPSAAGTPSAKGMPKGPRRADSDTTNAVSLNYGDPGESVPSENPVPGSAKPSAPVRKPPARRVSLSRARAEAIQSDETVEEGEISEGEHSKESANTPAVSAIPASAPVPPSLIATNSAKDVDPVLQPSATETDSDRTQLAAAQLPSALPKRSSISAGMQPPRPTANVHREPAPISPPTASFPSTHVPPTIRKLRTDQQPVDAYSNGIHSLPSLNTHDLSKNSPIDTVMSNTSHDDDSTDELSPKTSQMNQEVFAQLLQLGVDDEHCRPGLPMTFKQFNDAKQLILDLLGFGMTPENIADIGVNRRLLVYCLRELKIRLPINVPVDDIVLFDPPLDLSRDHDPDEVDRPHGNDPLPQENQEPSSPVQVPLEQNDDIPSIDLVEDTTADTLIVENVSESPSASLLPLPTDTIATASPPTPVSTPLPPAQSKLNVHAEPFLPAKPPPPTTGPSLPSMALPHQQIPPIPPREQFPLPPRPSFSLEAPSSRRSTAGSSSAPTVVPAVVTRTNTETEVAPQQDPGHLQRLEQEKKLLLLRAKLQRKARRRDSAPTSGSTEKPSLDTAVPSPSLILGGDRVGSPTQMEVDEQAPTSSSTASMEVTVISPTPVVTMPQRPPIQLRATLARALASGDSTRPSTPSENGQKRGVKRPKADDFVEDNYPKKSARLNGNLNAPPLKRSSFAIANSAPPEQLIITWIDDENIEVPAITAINLSREQLGTNAARDAEAAQVAAAAMAIGLPMTAEELEAARLQEEERKAQLNAKAAKLLQSRATLKRLELKKEEKKFSTLQKDPSAVAADILNTRHKMDILKQELETINAELAELQPADSGKATVRETPYVQSGTGVSTPELSVTHEHTAETSLASLPPPVVAASDSSSPDNDWEVLKDDDLDVIIAYDFSETADRPTVEQQEEHDVFHDTLHHEAASQSRLTPYSPPLILSVLTARRTPSNQLTYLNGDESLRTTDPSLHTIQFESSSSTIPFDPDRTLCQFESVGGVCRDADCKDLHFKDFPA